MTQLQLWYGAPGTGKTTKLAEEANILLQNGLEPEALGVFTFSNAAAEKLREEISKATGVEPENLHVSTLHAMCSTQIYEHYQDLWRLVKREDIDQFADDYGYEKPRKYSLYRRGTDWIPRQVSDPDLWKSLEIKHTRFPFHKTKDVAALLKLPKYTTPEKIVEFEGRWMERKEENHLMEFYDMHRMVLADKLIPDFSHQMHDEFQDVTPALYHVARLWMDSAKEVWVTGDPHQAIYSYLGASPEWFMKIKGKEDVLEDTWRLPRSMWHTALEMLRGAPDYFPKAHPITSVRAENRWCVIRRIPVERAASVVQGLDHRGESTMVLARTKGHLLELAGMLAKAGVVFSSLGQHPYGWTDTLCHLVNIKIRLRNKIPLASGQIEFLVGQAVPWIDLPRYTRGTTLEDIWRERFDHLPHEDQRKAVDARLKYGQTIPTAGARRIRLGTIHSAKGLEADNVVLWDRITRSIKNDLKQNAAAEARVWYVATSRAKKRLFIIHHPFPHYPIPIQVS